MKNITYMKKIYNKHLINNGINVFENTALKVTTREQIYVLFKRKY